MNQSLQHNSVEIRILLGVIVFLVIGLVGCAGAPNRPAGGPARDVAVPAPTESSVEGQVSARGEALYSRYCEECHGEKGKGKVFSWGSLNSVRGMDQATLSGIISKGQPSKSMPAFGKTMTQEEIAELVSFIRSW